MLCYAFAFKYYGHELSTDVISTHHLELTFGNIRQGSHSNDSSKLAVNEVAKSFLRDDWIHQFAKNISPTRGWSYISGSSFSDVLEINISDEIISDSISNEIIQIANNELNHRQFMRTNTWKFSIFLNENAKTIVPNLAGDTSGMRIMNRYHSQNKK